MSMLYAAWHDPKSTFTIFSTLKDQTQMCHIHILGYSVVISGKEERETVAKLQRLWIKRRHYYPFSKDRGKGLVSKGKPER